MSSWFPANESSPDAVPSRDPGFRTTRWSVVLAVRNQDPVQGQRALAELCRTYWYPLYAYIRRRGTSPPDAEDLTQGFFQRLLEKDYLGDLTPGRGRFRSFLLSALKHFLANEWDRSRARKRGGGCLHFSLDQLDAEERYRFEPADLRTPEALYEQGWALAVLDRVLARLREEFASGERGGLFDELKPFLAGEAATGAYEGIGARCGLKVGAIKVAVHRMRRRYGDLLRAEIAATLEDPNDVEDEIRHLLVALAGEQGSAGNPVSPSLR
jgi:DNA-directed RNA polymerase specialized sigma24 family protein